VQYLIIRSHTLKREEGGGGGEGGEEREREKERERDGFYQMHSEKAQGKKTSLDKKNFND
jgi:hypothetical protein